MHKAWRISGAILIAPVALVVGLFMLMLIVHGPPAIRDDIRERRFAQQLFDYPLPPGCVEYSRRSDHGVIDGNLPHCDYYAEVVMIGDATDELLSQHYGGMTVRHAAPRLRPDNLMPGEWYGTRIQRLPPDENGRNLIRVSISDGWYDPAWNILYN